MYLNHRKVLIMGVSYWRSTIRYITSLSLKNAKSLPSVWHQVITIKAMALITMTLHIHALVVVSCIEVHKNPFVSSLLSWLSEFWLSNFCHFSPKWAFWRLTIRTTLGFQCQFEFLVVYISSKSQRNHPKSAFECVEERVLMN